MTVSKSTADRYLCEQNYISFAEVLFLKGHLEICSYILLNPIKSIFLKANGICMIVLDCSSETNMLNLEHATLISYTRFM